MRCTSHTSACIFAEIQLVYVQLYLVTFGCLQRVCNALLPLLSLRPVLHTHQQFTTVVAHVCLGSSESIPHALTCIGIGHAAVAARPEHPLHAKNLLGIIPHPLDIIPHPLGIISHPLAIISRPLETIPHHLE